jgi:hypothetical protein
LHEVILELGNKVKVFGVALVSKLGVRARGERIGGARQDFFRRRGGRGRSRQFRQLVRLVFPLLLFRREYFEYVARHRVVFLFFHENRFLDLQNVRFDYLFDTAGGETSRVMRRRVSSE